MGAYKGNTNSCVPGKSSGTRHQRRDLDYIGRRGIREEGLGRNSFRWMVIRWTTSRRNRKRLQGGWGRELKKGRQKTRERKNLKTEKKRNGTMDRNSGPPRKTTKKVTRKECTQT